MPEDNTLARLQRLIDRAFQTDRPIYTRRYIEADTHAEYMREYRRQRAGDPELREQKRRHMRDYRERRRALEGTDR